MDATPTIASPPPLRIAIFSLHGLIRAIDPELGRDPDTGGQIKYVLELADELGQRPDVESVELITRQIIDDRVSSDYSRVEEYISEKARLFDCLLALDGIYAKKCCGLILKCSLIKHSVILGEIVCPA